MMWQKLFDKQGVVLNPSEREYVSAYEADPGGRAYYGMARILYRYEFSDEAIEVLLSGLARYPDDVVARVWLGYYLYQKQLFGLAWQTLEQAARHDLEDNTMGWGLRFKLAVLLGYTHHSAEAMAVLERMAGDARLEQMMSAYTLHGEGQVIELLAQEFELPLAEFNDLIKTARAWSRADGGIMAHAAQQGLPARGDQQSITEVEAENININRDRAASAPESSAYAGFYAVPLAEVLSVSSADGAASPSYGGELDSQTLAEIFEKQGYVQRALEIYRRMVAKHPSHDGYRQRLRELEVKIKAQAPSAAADLYGSVSVKSEMMSDLERKRSLKQRTQFLQELLEHLPREA